MLNFIESNTMDQKLTKYGIVDKVYNYVIFHKKLLGIHYRKIICFKNRMVCIAYFDSL